MTIILARNDSTLGRTRASHFVLGTGPLFVPRQNSINDDIGIYFGGRRSLAAEIDAFLGGDGPVERERAPTLLSVTFHTRPQNGPSNVTSIIFMDLAIRI